MKKYIINVNGSSYEVEVEEVKDGAPAQRPATPAARPAAPSPVAAAPVAAAPAPAKKEVAVSAGQEVIEAPMPGSVLKVLVKEGEEVKAGTVLLILEAMKMENEILSPRDGRVASIPTSAGTAVNAGDKLIVLE